MATYTDCEVGVSNAQKDVNKYTNELVSLLTRCQAISAQLAGLPTTYAEIITEMNLAAYDADEDWLRLRSRLGKTTADFSSLRTELDSLLAWKNTNITEF